MELFAKIVGGPEQDKEIEGIPLRSVRLSRVLGRPVKWSFTVDYSRDQHYGLSQIENIAGLISVSSPPCTIQPFLSDGAPLGPASVLNGAPSVGQENRQWVFEGVWTQVQRNTKTFDPLTDPLVPRRRVLHAKTLDQLVEQFEHVAFVSNEVKFDLSQIEFPDEDKAVFIQDGISDYEFLLALLYRFSQLNQMQNPLVLSGSASDEEPRWEIVWGGEWTYRDQGEPDKDERKIEIIGGDDREMFYSFGMYRGNGLGPHTPYGSTPLVFYNYPHRLFSAGRWNEWRVRDVPLYLEIGGQQRTIGSISDQLEVDNQGDIYWSSRMASMPAGGRVLPAFIQGGLRTWSGVGVVKKRHATEEWLEVELPGFQKDDKKGNLANVRVSTPYSGKGGKNGLHTVPEQDTHVLIGWSGDWNESVVLIQNTRMEPAEIGAPSIKFEDPTTWNMKDVNWSHEGASWSSGKVTWGTKDVELNSGKVDWNSGAVKWKSDKFETDASGYSVKSSGEAKIDGQSVAVNAQTSVDIKGQTDIKLNC